MSCVWTINFETNLKEETRRAKREELSFVRVFSTFEKAKEELKHLFKTLGEKENEFFDGDGNLKYLDEWIEKEKEDAKEDLELEDDEKGFELYCRTPEIMKSMFRGEEISPECLELIKAKIEREEGSSYVVFNRDSNYGTNWFPDTDYIVQRDGKSDGMHDIDYTVDCFDSQDEGYLYLRTNTFLLDDPDRDYYCYVRDTDWSYKDGIYFHVELEKHEVE